MSAVKPGPICISKITLFQNIYITQNVLTFSARIPSCLKFRLKSWPRGQNVIFKIMRNLGICRRSYYSSNLTIIHLLEHMYGLTLELLKWENWVKTQAVQFKQNIALLASDQIQCRS